MFNLIGQIVLEGLQIFSEERRTRIKDEYHDLISALNRAENNHSDSYTDADVDLIDQKIEAFLMAYHEELKAHNVENS